MSEKILLPMLIFPTQCAQAAEMLRAGGYELIENPGPNPFSLARFAAHFEEIVGVVCGSEAWTDPMFAHLPRLRALSRFGTGTDNIDLEAAAARGIACANTPGTNSAAVAEHALALMLEWMRRCGQYDAQLRRGVWEKRAGAELTGKTVGLIGFGSIARHLSRLLRGFDVKLLVYDPYLDPGDLSNRGARFCALQELLAASDIVSLHLPATDETRHMIDAAALSQMRPGALLINTARGSLVDSGALYQALKQGKIAGAALDVFETEPPPAGLPLFELDNFIGTPHVGGSTAEANLRTGVQAAQNLLDLLAGRPVPGRIV